MKNLLILYNPYYQNDVIEQHLKILKEKGRVAFGKVKSKLKDRESEFSKELEQIYKHINSRSPLQLFLTDYANLFVAKVVQVCRAESSLTLDSSEPLSTLLPLYYIEKNMEIEHYFIITDLRELVREDFSTLRDTFLANFTTPHYKGHSYAIYGNYYTYPLLIEQKEEICYFEEDSRHYLDVFHSTAYLHTQSDLITYVFGEEIFKLLHPDSIANIISAELEFKDNAHNPLYDFTSVIVKYAKTIEYEIYTFIQTLFTYLLEQNPSLENISYNVQGHQYIIRDIFTHKPNLGTMSYLLLHDDVELPNMRDARAFVKYELPKCIKTLQPIRNESVHKSCATLQDAHKIRNLIIGIRSFSVLKALVLYKDKLKQSQAKGKKWQK